MENRTSPAPTTSGVKVYERRWLILFLFILYAAIGLMQWVQYFIITDVIVSFYGVSYTDLNKIAMAYLLVSVIFLFPGVYIFEKAGLRRSVIFATFGTAVGAWIKTASAVPDRFWVLFLGQIIVCSFQVLILPAPTKLAATWFSPNEVSTACSAGVIGYMVGESFGIVLPTLIVNSNQSLEEMREGFQNMAYGVAGVCTFILILIVLFFEDKPPQPPSIAEIKMGQERTSFNTFQATKKLFSNQASLLIIVSYGTSNGVVNALQALLNQIVLHYYPGGSYDAGIMGLLAVFSGMIGSILAGIVLDKYRIYRTAALVSLTVSCLVMALFSFIVTEGIWVMYTLITIFGCSSRAMTTIALESAAEVTYPEPVITSSAVLTTVPQLLAIPITYLYSCLFYGPGVTYANLACSAILIIGIIAVVFTRYDLKRHNTKSVDTKMNDQELSG